MNKALFERIKVGKQRPDCSFIDTQPMTYPWYIKMLGHHFAEITFPGKRYHLQRKADDFTLAEFIRKNPKRNIFGCIGLQELETIAKDGIWSMPWGVCEQFFVRSNFSEQNWDIEKQERYSSDRLALSKWSHEPSEASYLPNHSWEKVANDEIYAGIVKSAMWSFDAAEEAKKSGKKEEAKQFYAWSYAFYKNAIEKMGDKSPSYWYKNAALIHPTAAQFVGNVEGTGTGFGNLVL